MDKKVLKFLFILTFFNNTYQAGSQLIKDPAMLVNIEKQLLIQKELAKARSNDLFGPFKPTLSTTEKQAVDFIYAYMPLSDLADYSRQFFVDNVRMSLKARDEMLWGKNIPEDVFLHFVLPLRVNNENLDSFRILMYDEIKSRIKGMAMKDAVLELNHWCHEKVTYKASDERTSSPLSSMRYSFGRCGEESTFTVNALRAAGIPARQVYTPRWAHTDDNHAWVEAWVDGKWYFLGACEPGSELNMGWFAAPATRAMLMNTRAYGWYNGPEPRIENEARFSELNLIANYAPVKKIFVKILNQKNLPVENAKVEFQLYNYAEFYPLTKSYTGKNGLTSITTGFGDLLIWANKELFFGYKKITVKNTDTVIIQLKSDYRNGSTEEFDFVPPVEGEIVKENEQGKLENDRRLQLEDSIRHEYMKSFKDSAWAAGFSQKMETNSDSTIRFIVSSYGNWSEIMSFLENIKPKWRSDALKLLSVISAKDLRDIKSSILSDHFKGALIYKELYKNNCEIWEKYLLSGRISNEMMVGWREFLSSNLKISYSKRSEIPDLIKKWVEKNIKIDLIANAHSRAPLSPVGVYKLKVADLKSRDIFFVAACRANGIASRLQPETLIPQVWEQNRWNDIYFSSNSLVSKPKAYLNLKNASRFDPKYFIHFTLALFDNGTYRSLQFGEEKPLSQFPSTTEVPAGNYMLVTGNRQQDGSVLCSIVYFELKANETKEILVKVREVQKSYEVWGRVNFNEFSVKKLDNGKTVKLSEIINNKPSLIIFIEPDKEPTKHVMVDLQPMKAELEKWGGAIVFVLHSNKTSKTFSQDMFPGLASQSIFVWDEQGEFLKKIESLKSMQLTDNMPVIIFSDSSGNLSFFSKGYTIGVGDQLIKILK